MKNWKRLVSGLLSLMLLASLTTAAFAAERTEKEAPKPAGQFSQWFPRLGTNPEAPEASEAVLARMGTAVRQSKTVKGAAVTLNAAVWDGKQLRMSLTVKAKDLPKELTAGSRIYAEECWLTMPEDSWKEYVRKDETSHYVDNGMEIPEWMEESVQNRLNMGQKDYWNHHAQLNFCLLSREKDTLTFEVDMELKNLLEKPELTLHVENIAIYEDSDEPIIWQDGKRTGPKPEIPVLSGPFDFRFTLEKCVPSIRYTGNVKVTVENIPLEFTGFEFSVLDMDGSYKVLAPVNPVRVSTDSREKNKDLLDDHAVTAAMRKVLLGVWTKDGKYVDFENCVGSQSLITNPKDNSATGSVGRAYPYVTDPAAVTAVNLGGTRVELGTLNRVTG